MQIPIPQVLNSTFSYIVIGRGLFNTNKKSKSVTSSAWGFVK